MTREFKKCGNINIPLNWEYRPIKTIIRGISDGTHGTFERVRDGYPLLSAKNVFDDGIHIGDNESQISEEAFNEITANGYPHKDDILLCCVGTIGRSTIYPYEKPMAFQRSVIFLTLNQNLMLPEMMHYLLMSDDVKAQENNLINQSAQAGLYQGSVKQIRVVVPPLTEQKEIIRFLNSSCHRIDNAISRHQQIIEKLEEYRKSAITQAVTKGLNPDAEMKNSGIDIIGQMPAHWSLIRLRYLCKITTGDGDTQDAEPGGEYPFYVRSPIIERSNRYTFDGEGILMAGDGVGAGRVFHHAYGKYAVHQRVYRLYNINNIDSDYLFYYMQAMFPNQMDKGSAQSTVPSVRLPMLKNFNITVPTLDDQKAIVTYIKDLNSSINNIKERHSNLIEELREYKKSLIYNAVTGKIDCREVE